MSRWRRASTSRCSVSSRRFTSTASRREPPTVVTGDRLPQGRADPNLTPSPPPDTPTVGAEDGPGRFRGEAGGNTAVSPSSRPEQGGLSLPHGAPSAGKALEPCLAVSPSVVGGGGVTSPLLSALIGGLEGNLEKPEGGGVLSRAEIPRGRKTAQNWPKGPVPGAVSGWPEPRDPSLPSSLARTSGLITACGGWEECICASSVKCSPERDKQMLVGTGRERRKGRL